MSLLRWALMTDTGCLVDRQLVGGCVQGWATYATSFLVTVVASSVAVAALEARLRQAFARRQQQQQQSQQRQQRQQQQGSWVQVGAAKQEPGLAGAAVLLRDEVSASCSSGVSGTYASGAGVRSRSGVLQRAASAGQVAVASCTVHDSARSMAQRPAGIGSKLAAQRQLGRAVLRRSLSSSSVGSTGSSSTAAASSALMPLAAAAPVSAEPSGWGGIQASLQRLTAQAAAVKQGRGARSSSALYGDLRRAAGLQQVLVSVKVSGRPVHAAGGSRDSMVSCTV